jgi:hypothetical protein
LEGTAKRSQENVTLVRREVGRHLTRGIWIVGCKVTGGKRPRNNLYVILVINELASVNLSALQVRSSGSVVCRCMLLYAVVARCSRHSFRSLPMKMCALYFQDLSEIRITFVCAPALNERNFPAIDTILPRVVSICLRLAFILLLSILHRHCRLCPSWI